MSYWDILVPETCTNMVLNPVGGDTDNVTAESSGTLTSMVTTYSYLGPYCHRIVGAGDNQGMSYTLSALSNAIHYMTLRINVASDVVTFDCSLDNATYTEPSLLSTEGDWWVYGLQFPAAQANGSTKLYIRQKGASAAIDIYLGHAQVEAKEYPTTPVTGDLKNCYWTGAANKSTSVRPAWDRTGGRVYDLDTQYGMYLATYPGIGSPEMERYQTALSLLPGSLDDGHKVLPREFTLVGEQTGTTWANMHYKRKNLIDVLKPDAVKGDQPVTLRYRGANTSRPVEIKAFYLGGMEFTEHEGFTTKQAVRLRANDPYWYDPYETTAHLTVSQNVADADYIVRRSSGNWTNISTNFNDAVWAVAKGQDGNIYIGGEFNEVGDSNGSCIIKWNPNTAALSSLASTSPTTDVYALALSPNGNIWLGGAFINLQDANGDRVSYFDGTNYNSVGSGMDGIVYALAAVPAGQIWATGAFTQKLAYSNEGSAVWATPATGANNDVNDICVAPNNYLYITGTFTSVGGVSCNYIARVNPDGTFSPLGTGLAGGGPEGEAIICDKAGNVYVTGNFTSAGGDTNCAYIAKWNGQRWESLGTGLNGIGYALGLDDKGLLYVSGAFTAAGGLTTTNRTAVWNGSSWVHLDIALPGSPNVHEIKAFDDDLYIGYDTSGIATSSYVNTVTNNGTARAYPKFVVKLNSKDSTGTAIVEYLDNITSGFRIWLNYTLMRGEKLELNFDPQNLTCESSFFGSRWDAVLRGSDIGNFYLLPGSNSVSAFVNSTTDASVTSYLIWRNAYESADGGSTA